MFDIFGNELMIGDKVAFNPPIYKGLVVGEVIGFTPKCVRVKYNPHGKQHTKDVAVISGNLVKDIK